MANDRLEWLQRVPRWPKTGPRQAQDSGNLGHLGAILGDPGVILSRLGAILGSLGPSWGHLEAVLGVPEAILGSLGAVLGHLGSVLALSWAIPERPRASQFRDHFLEPRLLRKPYFLQGKTNILRFVLGSKTGSQRGGVFHTFWGPRFMAP